MFNVRSVPRADVESGDSAGPQSSLLQKNSGIVN